MEFDTFPMDNLHAGVLQEQYEQPSIRDDKYCVGIVVISLLACSIVAVITYFRDELVYH